jgi:son of sevenless
VVTLSQLLGLVAVDNTALNVVCNQEYAQVISHVCLTSFHFSNARAHCKQVHYHIIPAPRLGSLPTGLRPGPGNFDQELPLTARDMHRKESELRDDLDEDDGHTLVEKIKAHL